MPGSLSISVRTTVSIAEHSKEFGGVQCLSAAAMICGGRGTNETSFQTTVNCSITCSDDPCNCPTILL